MESVTKTNLVEVNINQLIKEPNHPRQESGNLDSLITSVKKDGILSPITVIKVNESVYHVIDGDRRVEVAKKLGTETITCIVLEGYEPATAAHKSYVLNNERNHLNEIEKTLHVKKMKDTFGYSHTDLEMMGYGSKSSVSKRLNLLNLPSKVQESIANGELTMAHGGHLLKLNDSEKIEKTAKMAVANNWSATNTKSFVEKHNRKMNKANKEDEKVRIPVQEVPGVYFKDAKDMSELPADSIGCIMSSPPYHIGMEFEQDSYDEHLENIEKVMSECARVLFPGGVMALNVGDIHSFKGPKGKNKFSQIQPMAHIYQQFLRKHKIYLKDQIVWVKNATSFSLDNRKNYTDDTKHTEYRIVTRHEPVLIFRKTGERPVPSEDIVLDSMLTREEWKMYAPSVWTIDPVRNPEGHPAMFPDELAARIIKMYSFIGETILDPFLGSGTTIKVARELGRDGVGYERDTKYKETIMKKLGVAEKPVTEGVGAFVKRTMEEADANQPEKPEVEVIASEGMQEEAEKILADKKEELETV